MLVIVLLALAIVAFLARDSLQRYFGMLTGGSETIESRLPPAARPAADATSSTPTITAPVERARAVEGVVQQQADDMAKRIEREAR